MLEGSSDTTMSCARPTSVTGSCSSARSRERSANPSRARVRASSSAFCRFVRRVCSPRSSARARLRPTAEKIARSRTDHELARIVAMLSMAAGSPSVKYGYSAPAPYMRESSRCSRSASQSCMKYAPAPREASWNLGCVTGTPARIMARASSGMSSDHTTARQQSPCRS